MTRARTMTFAVRRARQQTARLLLVLLAAGLVVLGVGGIDALSGRLVDDGVRQVAEHAESGTRVATVTALSTGDPAAQDRAVRAAIAKAFAGAPVAVSRMAVSQISLGNPDAVQAIGGEGVTDRGDLVEGAWPARSGEAAVLKAAAEIRGWRIGDRIRLGADASGGVVDVLVVGTWRAKDPTAPAWAGDPAVASGDSDGAVGPVLITDEDMTRLWTTPTVTWTIAPIALTADSLSAYRAGLERLSQLPAKVDPESRSSTAVGGSLGDLLDRQTRAVSGARGMMAVPTAIIVALGAIAIAVILTSMAGARRAELRLVRARGAAVTGVAVGAAGEAAAATGAGAVLALIVMLPLAAPGLPTIAAAALTVLIAAVAAAFTAARASAPTSGIRSDAGRGIVTALLVPTLIVTALAAFALWQLFAQGGVISEGGAADPVASAAGAVALLAFGLLVPLLAVLAAAAAERAARSGRGIMPVLPLRQIARRAGSVAVAILCMALAAGSATMALGAAPLAAAVDRSEVRAALGLDVRVSVAGQGAVPLTATEAAALPTVTRAAEVLSRDADIGSDTVAFLAADPSAEAIPASDQSAITGGSGSVVPVAITTALAQRLSAVRGTTFSITLRPEGTRLPAQVATIVPTIAGIGSGPGILADRTAAAARAGGLRSNELWLSTSDASAVATEVRTRASSPMRILTAAAVSTAPITGTATILLTIGSAAAALLGLLGFLAAVAADRTRRNEERTALRALGLSAGRQRSARLGEVTGIAVFGLLGGAAAGFAVVALVLPVMWGSGA